MKCYYLSMWYIGIECRLTIRLRRRRSQWGGRAARPSVWPASGSRAPPPPGWRPAARSAYRPASATWTHSWRRESAARGRLQPPSTRRHRRLITRTPRRAPVTTALPVALCHRLLLYYSCSGGHCAGITRFWTPVNITTDVHCPRLALQSFVTHNGVLYSVPSIWAQRMRPWWFIICGEHDASVHTLRKSSETGPFRQGEEAARERDGKQQWRRRNEQLLRLMLALVWLVSADSIQFTQNSSRSQFFSGQNDQNRLNIK